MSIPPDGNYAAQIRQKVIRALQAVDTRQQPGNDAELSERLMDLLDITRSKPGDHRPRFTISLFRVLRESSTRSYEISLTASDGTGFSGICSKPLNAFLRAVAQIIDHPVHGAAFRL